MSVLLWAVLALLAGLVALTLSARRALRPRAPLVLPPGETFPATLLQRRARVTLLTGLVLALAAGVVIVRGGVETFYEQEAVRIPVTLLLLAALVVFAGFGMRAAAWARQPDGPLDERDLAILEKAPALEGLPMILTLVLWVVGLQQTYWEQGAVPLVYLYLIFWSVLLVKALALPVGVLVGYRRS